MKIKKELLVGIICDHIEKSTVMAVSQGAKLTNTQLCMEPRVFEFINKKGLQNLVDMELQVRRTSFMFSQASGEPN